MARSRLSAEKQVHPTIPRVSPRNRAPRPLPGEALRELPLHDASVPGKPVGGSPAAWVIVPEDLGSPFEVTGRMLCRVPVANDVRLCGCGGVFSDLFNGRSLCRSCGRER